MTREEKLMIRIGQDGDERISVYSIEKRTGRTFDALLTFISDRIARICR